MNWISVTIDAVTALFTAVAGVAAAYAAFSARGTARDARQALALHHRPTVWWHATLAVSDGGAADHPPVHLRLSYSSESVRQVRLSWTSADARQTHHRPTDPDTLIELTGIQARLDDQQQMDADNLAELTCTCIDSETGTAWSSSAPQGPDGRVSLRILTDMFRFEPEFRDG